MRHYELEDWVDFVRGLGDPEQRRAMEEHLASGIDSSAQDVSMLEQVRTVIVEDAESCTPEPQVWAAKMIFDVGQPQSGLHLPPIPLELVSQLPADPLDGREEKPYDPTRQLAYEGTDFGLLLWLEDPYESSGAAVLGHLGRRDEKNTPIPDASVVLLEDGSPVAAAVTNRFGEFQIETLAEGQLRVRIVIRDEGQIDLEIPEKKL